MADLPEATRLLEQALHLRQAGERAPGGTETWQDWDLAAEAYLRKLHSIPAGDHTQARDWLAAELRRHGLPPGAVTAVMGAADTYAARAAAQERTRLFAELGNDHFAIFTRDRWTVEHSVECKLSGHMHECEYHTAVERIADGGFSPALLGRWKITGTDSEGRPEMVRQETADDTP